MTTNRRRPAPEPTVALIVDVDGVVSAVHPETHTFGDEVVAGRVCGPVFVSPTLCARLDALAAAPGVLAAWLTSWETEMRADMAPFPGTSWPVVAPFPSGPGGALTDGAAEEDAGWWKQAALGRWLEERPHIRSVVWCDDHLAPVLRLQEVADWFAARAVEVLLVAPDLAVGLTEQHLDRIENWVGRRTTTS